MRKPTVVIIGRPNVGKSTLFNRIVGATAAIVEDIPGVTRDLNYKDADWNDRRFIVCDTGGFYPTHDDNIFVQIKEQALFAVDEADVIIHLLDGKEGLNPYDADIVKLLRASGKRVIWAVNKVDAPTREDRMIEFYSLGVEDVLAVSAATGYNFDDLMDRVIEGFPSLDEAETEYPEIAIVGRPNAGKSTFINTLLGKKRLLVSPVAGTTRDAIDTECIYYGKKYLLIDTAGIRRKDRLGYSVERFAMMRAKKAIARADVAVLLIDATTGVVSDDQKIAGIILESLTSAVIVLNKWDMIKEDHEVALKKLKDQINDKLFFFRHAPVLTASGLEKTRVTKLFPVLDEVLAERNKRIPTSELNRFVEQIILPSVRGRRLRIYYMTQYHANPPSFALFTNRPDEIKDPVLRHIESRLREEFSFKGTPLLIKVRQK